MRDRDSIILESLYKSILLNEAVLNIDAFGKQLLGAFRVVFDLDRDQVDANSNNTLHTPYSQTIGMRSFEIGYDYRVPEKKCANVISTYFPINYKNKTYIIDMLLYYWNEKPTVEDFTDIAYGKNIKHGYKEQKDLNQIDTSKILTVNGDVKEVVKDWNEREPDEVEIGSIEPEPHNPRKSFTEPQTGSFYHYSVLNSDLSNLALRVKSIIDGYDKRKHEKERIDSPSGTSKPIPKFSKELVPA